MTIKDIGPEPTVFDIEDETTGNDAYRRVAWSGKYLQVTLMSIPAGGEIGWRANFSRISLSRPSLSTRSR